ncbi:hypothetical protein [Candidatus Nitrotoga fabula]|uniref:hypothetical protein n=1 Tax=Candidatus Nitrotoga fabula TaxID=2182327 RepID=UPI001BB47C87|nr:hypothetical protein [Candidatus Nitrotoga fabula]
MLRAAARGNPICTLAGRIPGNNNDKTCRAHAPPVAGKPPLSRHQGYRTGPMRAIRFT